MSKTSGCALTYSTRSKHHGPNSCDSMVNDTDYQQLNINADTMLDNDYEPGNLFLNFIYTNSNVLVNEQEGNNFDSYENNEEVQEIYETDINIEQPTNIWDDNSIRYLIYCWSQLRDQFANCPDKKKESLWQHVSGRLMDHGFYFDAQACDTKWRSLKKVYMYNKTRNCKKDGSKHQFTWNHYSEMDKAIKGIPYEISDIENDDDDDVDNNGENEDDDYSTRENVDNIGEYDNADSTRSYVDKCQWTVDSTRELIRLYGKDGKKFSAVNQGGKHLLWEDIANQFSQLGYQYSASNCNDKWRNLKMTYKKNKQRAIKYGIEYVKWCYFKDMDNIFKNTPEGSPELNDIITVSLIDDELVDIKKENEDYVNLNVVETNENNEEEPNEPLSASTSDIWTEQATKCLIELWGLYRPRFLLAAQGKKRLLWNEISNQLRQNGHNYSGLVCDRKWRLLKANYVKRREKYKKLGVNSVKWQYYHDLDRLLGVPAESISWSMDSTMCLIDCFDNHKEKFMNAATGEKLLIWKQISEEMSQHGFNYTPRACDNKWRTLKNRYNKNRMRTNRNKKVIWVYYNKIDSVLREINKNGLKDEYDNGDENNQSNEVNELDEHNYIRTSKPSSNKTNSITELQTMFRLRNNEFDQRLKQMEDNLNSREKVFEELQLQMLDALKRSNELESHKLRLLEQLVSRLPNQN